MQVSKVAFENSLWKRCDAHVRISRFIQILQTPENQERFQPQPNLLGPKEGSKLGVLMASNDFHEVRKSVYGLISSSNLCNFIAEANSNEAKTCILQLQGLDQDRPQAALAASQMHIRQKQVSFYCNCQWFLPFQLFDYSVTGRVSISCLCRVEVVGWKLRIILIELQMGSYLHHNSNLRIFNLWCNSRCSCLTLFPKLALPPALTPIRFQ